MLTMSASAGPGALWQPGLDPAAFAPGNVVPVPVPETPGLVLTDNQELGVGYVRVSTQPQEEGTSPQKQGEGILSSAQRHDVHIPAPYLVSETGSGADFGRLGFRTVCAIVASGKVKHFFAHDSDRLTRDPLLLVQFLRFCADNGVTVHFSDGAVGRSAVDEVMQYIKGFFGFQEREKIAERTMDGKRKVAEMGRLPNGTGLGTFGYDYDPVTHTRTINEPEAAIVVEIYNRFLGGEAINAMVKDLRDRGVRTKGGHLFHPRLVRDILRNETYTGEHWWGTRRYEKLPTSPDGGPKRRVTPQPQERWVRITGFSPQIIQPTLWAIAQGIFGSRSGRAVLWDYLFSGFFNCAECGSHVVGATQRRKGKIYPYYRCTGTVPNYYRPKVCYMRSFRADKLEPAVLEHLFRVIRDPGAVVARLRAAVSGRDSDLHQRLAALERRVQKCRSEEGGLHMKHVRQEMDDRMFQDLLAPVVNLRIQLEREIDLLTRQSALSDGLDRLETEFQALCLQYSGKLDELGSGDLRKLLRLLNVRLSGTPERVSVTGVLDPSLFTTVRTWACSPNWDYTVVLKPNPSKWPAVKLRSGRRKRSAR